MDFKKIILLLGVTTLLITSCDKQYDLEVNGEKLTKNIEFSCGKVQITAYSMFRNTIFINQKYSSTNQAKFYRDSLQIEYKGNIIPFDIYDKDEKINTSVIEIVNEEDYDIICKIDDTLPLFNEGNIITIKDNGYLYCGNKRVDIGIIELTVRL